MSGEGSIDRSLYFISIDNTTLGNNNPTFEVPYFTDNYTSRFYTNRFSKSDLYTHHSQFYYIKVPLNLSFMMESVETAL